jgi:hypothetical protein
VASLKQDFEVYNKVRENQDQGKHPNLENKIIEKKLEVQAQRIGR